MSIAIYPGSFNPWHSGHSDILRKALKIFDKVVVGAGRNPEKAVWDYNLNKLCDDFKEEYCYCDANGETRVTVRHFTGLLVDHIKEISSQCKIDAVIRGLRNGDDLQYEMNQQYWNEDLGLNIPVVYFICDRSLAHISSSTIRLLEKIKNGEVCKTT